VQLGPVDAGLAVIDDEQQVLAVLRGLRQSRARLLEKVTDPHQLVYVGEILARRRMKDQRLPVSGEPQVSVGFVRGVGQRNEH
jgi:hypothetical protein